MHHAYIYEGARSLLPELAQHARSNFGFIQEHDPDVSVQSFEKFGVEEARTVREIAGLKSLSGRGLFVIGISSITTEAQQALLKLFEEPQQGITFVLLVPHGVLIPTLRSRFLAYPEKLKERGEHDEAKKFLKASYKTRSAHITAMLKDEENQRERVREFLQGVEKILYAESKKRMAGGDVWEGLNDITKVRSYVGDRSPALKMLLEHLAATLPTV